MPSRTALIITGDIDRNQVLRDCEELFGQYRATGVSDPVFSYDTPPAETQQLSEVTRGSQSQIYMAYLGPSVKTKPDIYQVDVLCFLMGHGEGSLLAKRLETDTSNIEGRLDFLTQTHPGMINLVVHTPPGQEDEAVKKVEGVIADVCAGKFTDEDLKRAKTILSALYEFGNETNSGKADSLGLYETMDSSKFAVTYLKEIDKVSAADVTAAAKKYLGSNHVTYILKAPKKGV